MLITPICCLSGKFVCEWFTLHPTVSSLFYITGRHEISETKHFDWLSSMPEFLKWLVTVIIWSYCYTRWLAYIYNYYTVNILKKLHAICKKPCQHLDKSGRRDWHLLRQPYQALKPCLLWIFLAHWISSDMLLFVRSATSVKLIMHYITFCVWVNPFTHSSTQSLTHPHIHTCVHELACACALACARTYAYALQAVPSI